jgi:CubicO group peptidase (beta-lactamase class C family)
VGQECVIDVIMTDKPGFTADHKTIVMSSGKTVACVAMAMQVDKGTVKYDEKVATYWPEFGQNGKENMLVEDIMRHEAGMPKAPE